MSKITNVTNNTNIYLKLINEKKENTVYEIDEKIKSKLRDQYFIELKNHVFYLLCAFWFQNKKLSGFVNFFKIQSNEEFDHSKRFSNYILDRKLNIKVETCKLKDSLKGLDTPEKIIRASYEREKYNSKNIQKLMLLAIKKNDFHLQFFLEWFVDEQLEEETLFEDVIKKFDLLKESKMKLYEIDKYLGTRKEKKNKKL